MQEYNATIGENGRMIIPVLFRKTLGLKKGDKKVFQAKFF